MQDLNLLYKIVWPNSHFNEESQYFCFEWIIGFLKTLNLTYFNLFKWGTSSFDMKHVLVNLQLILDERLCAYVKYLETHARILMSCCNQGLCKQSCNMRFMPGLPLGLLWGWIRSMNETLSSCAKYYIHILCQVSETDPQWGRAHVHHCVSTSSCAAGISWLGVRDD